MPSFGELSSWMHYFSFKIRKCQNSHKFILDARKCRRIDGHDGSNWCLSKTLTICEKEEKGAKWNFFVINYADFVKACKKCCHLYLFRRTILRSERLRWSGGSVLAFGTQVRGFKLGRSRRIFRAKKFPVRLPSEGK